MPVHSNILIEKYIELVNKQLIPYRSKFKGEQLDDIYSDAIVGLWKAIQKHPEMSEEDFKRYARSKIRCEIKEGLRQRYQLKRTTHKNNEDNPVFNSLESLKDAQDYLAIEDHGFDNVDQKDFLDYLLGKLNPFEHELINKRFFENKTYSAIAIEMGMNEKTVSRCIRRILVRLKEIATNIE